MTLVPRALVLSGGGAKTRRAPGRVPGAARGGLRADWYVGTSMGAVIAADSPGGAMRLLERMASGSSRIVRDPLAPVAGLFSRSLSSRVRFGRHRGAGPVRRFADLTVPLTVTAVDLDTGELVLFGAGRANGPAGGCALRQLRIADVLPTGDDQRTPVR